MKMRIGIFLTLVLISFIISVDQIQAQIIFREDKPVIKPIWNRVADYSPTLRSVEAAEISPDGRHVISGSKFGYYLMLWSVADGNLVWEKILDAEIEAVTFSPDGKYIAAGDEAYKVTIFDIQGNVVKVLEHEAAFDGITWSPDGKYVGGGSEIGEVVLWNSKTWKKEIILEAGETVNSLQFTADSKNLIAAGNKMNPNPTHDWDRHGFVKAWNVEKDFSVLFEIRAQEKSSKSVRLSPDEKSFAVAGFANQVKVYSFPEAQELAVFDVPEKLEAIEFHPEGNFLFAGGHSEVLHIYSTKKFEEVSTFPCRRVEYIDFSNDGRLMVTGHEDGGLLSLYMLISKVQTSDDYQELSNQILNNKDLK